MSAKVNRLGMVILWMIAASFAASGFYTYNSHAASDAPVTVTTRAEAGKNSDGEYGGHSNIAKAPGTAADVFTVKANADRIMISALPGTPFQLFNALGTEIFSGIIPQSGNYEHPVQRGIYFVKAGEKLKRVNFF